MSVKIEIETAIRNISWATAQVGQKSLQKIVVDFKGSTVTSAFSTGKTSILGMEVGSIRDSFTVTAVRFVGGTAFFTATGETASAVGVVPNINYSFKFEVKETELILSGSHDGYPSYKVTVGGSSAYDHVQGYVGQLAGDSDVKVTRRTFKILSTS